MTRKELLTRTSSEEKTVIELQRDKTILEAVKNHQERELEKLKQELEELKAEKDEEKYKLKNENGNLWDELRGAKSDAVASKTRLETALAAEKDLEARMETDAAAVNDARSLKYDYDSLVNAKSEVDVKLKLATSQLIRLGSLTKEKDTLTMKVRELERRLESNKIIRDRLEEESKTFAEEKKDVVGKAQKLKVLEAICSEQEEQLERLEAMLDERENADKNKGNIAGDLRKKYEESSKKALELEAKLAVESKARETAENLRKKTEEKLDTVFNGFRKEIDALQAQNVVKRQEQADIDDRMAEMTKQNAMLESKLKIKQRYLDSNDEENHGLKEEMTSMLTELKGVQEINAALKQQFDETQKEKEQLHLQCMNLETQLEDEFTSHGTEKYRMSSQIQQHSKLILHLQAKMKEVEEERRKKRGIFGGLISKESKESSLSGKDGSNTLPRIMAEINVAPPAQLTPKLDLKSIPNRSSTRRPREHDPSKDAKDSVNLKRQKKNVHVDFSDENIIHEISADRESLASAEGVSLASDSIEDLRDGGSSETSSTTASSDLGSATSSEGTVSSLGVMPLQEGTVIESSSTVMFTSSFLR